MEKAELFARKEGRGKCRGKGEVVSKREASWLMKQKR